MLSKKILSNTKTYQVILSKQQAFDMDPKAIQQINVTVNLDQNGNTKMFFIIQEAKEIILDFHKELLEHFEFILL